MGVLGLGLGFVVHFMHDFSIKMFFIWYSIYGQGFNVIPFFLVRISKKCVIEFLFRQLIMSWTLRFIFDHPPKQWPTGRKRGKGRNTKKWISWERKRFLDEIKSIFHSFWRAIIWWKNKNLMKTADTSFNKRSLKRFKYWAILLYNLNIFHKIRIEKVWETVLKGTQKSANL